MDRCEQSHLIGVHKQWATLSSISARRRDGVMSAVTHGRSLNFLGVRMNGSITNAYASAS